MKIGDCLMLTTKIFNDSINDLKIAFPELKMTKERAQLWYRYCKHLEDSIFRQKISSCIEYCNKNIPLLADIINPNNYKREQDGHKKYRTI